MGNCDRTAFFSQALEETIFFPGPSARQVDAIPMAQSPPGFLNTSQPLASHSANLALLEIQKRYCLGLPLNPVLSASDCFNTSPSGSEWCFLCLLCGTFEDSKFCFTESLLHFFLVAVPEWPSSKVHRPSGFEL